MHRGDEGVVDRAAARVKHPPADLAARAGHDEADLRGGVGDDARRDRLCSVAGGRRRTGPTRVYAVFARRHVAEDERAVARRDGTEARFTPIDVGHHLLAPDRVAAVVDDHAAQRTGLGQDDLHVLDITSGAELDVQWRLRGQQRIAIGGYTIGAGYQAGDLEAAGVVEGVVDAGGRQLWVARGSLHGCGDGEPRHHPAVGIEHGAADRPAGRDLPDHARHRYLRDGDRRKARRDHISRAIYPDIVGIRAQRGEPDGAGLVDGLDECLQAGPRAQKDIPTWAAARPAVDGDPTRERGHRMHDDRQQIRGLTETEMHAALRLPVMALGLHPRLVDARLQSREAKLAVSVAQRDAHPDRAGLADVTDHGDARAGHRSPRAHHDDATEQHGLRGEQEDVAVARRAAVLTRVRITFGVTGEVHEARTDPQREATGAVAAGARRGESTAVTVRHPCTLDHAAAEVLHDAGDPYAAGREREVDAIAVLAWSQRQVSSEARGLVPRRAGMDRVAPRRQARERVEAVGASFAALRRGVLGGQPRRRQRPGADPCATQRRAPGTADRTGDTRRREIHEVRSLRHTGEHATVRRSPLLRPRAVLRGAGPSRERDREDHDDHGDQDDQEGQGDDARSVRRRRHRATASIPCLLRADMCGDAGTRASTP